MSTVDTPTAGYRINITCPRCGHPVTHQTGSVPNPHEQRAVIRCTHCPTQAVLTVTLVAISNEQDGFAHGTDAGYALHRRRSEPACTACKNAHAEAVRFNKARRKAREKAAVA